MDIVDQVSFPSFGEERVVCLTSANAWYIDTLVYNLLISAAIYEPTLKIAVFCTDDKAVEKCRALNFPYYTRFQGEAMEEQDTDSTTDGYTRLSFVKVALCKMVLDRGYIPLYIDPDQVFMKIGTIDNLLEYLHTYPSSSLRIEPEYDFVCAGSKEYMNSNILIARPTAETRNLFALTQRDIERVVNDPLLRGDEDFFRPRLSNCTLNWTTVNRQEYPQGCDLVHGSEKRIIHANCVSGLNNKIKLLKQWNAWFLIRFT